MRLVQESGASHSRKWVIRPQGCRKSNTFGLGDRSVYGDSFERAVSLSGTGLVWPSPPCGSPKSRPQPGAQRLRGSGWALRAGCGGWGGPRISCGALSPSAVLLAPSARPAELSEEVASRLFFPL